MGGDSVSIYPLDDQKLMLKFQIFFSPILQAWSAFIKKGYFFSLGRYTRKYNRRWLKNCLLLFADKKRIGETQSVQVLL